MPTATVPDDALSEWLRSRDCKDLLRVLTCGSVDDGKSTLIGRLLYDSRAIFSDQLADVKDDSRRWGTRGNDVDLALLVDGLAAEREQGITIDVAYRYFATKRRNFVVADTPGHEQYTRNMATGASTADAAVLLVDARKGVLTQTKRHMHIVALLGIRQVALAVNKMDLLDFARPRFAAISDDCRAFAARLGILGVAPIPISALDGDNVVRRSERTPWYAGPTLMEWLDDVDVDNLRKESRPFRMHVQLVSRPFPEFRGLAGTIISGRVRAGDTVRVLPNGRISTVARLVAAGADRNLAVAGQPVLLTLGEAIDVSRGDTICAIHDSPEVADQLVANLVWMHEEPLHVGCQYLLKLGTQTLSARVTEVQYRLDADTLEQVAGGKQLHVNEIGLCNLTLDRPVVYEPYMVCRETGGFILIDRTSNATVAAGMIESGMRRAKNIRSHPFEIDKAARAKAKGQEPCVLWFTGLPGAGKSTIANLVEKKLHAMGKHTYVLDGDSVRHGLCCDLGFTAADRAENLRRVGEVVKIMVDAGLIVLAAFISPFAAGRQSARALVAEDEFFEVFVDVPLALAEARDPKGLYAKARRGELSNVTGVDQPYEAPTSPELRIDALTLSADQAAERVLALLVARGRV